MKRISVALAALAVLIVGTASARVPDVSSTSRKTAVAPARAQSPAPSTVEARSLAGLSAVDGVAVIRRAADRLPGGLPDVLTEILAALPVLGAPADEAVPEEAPEGPLVPLSSEPAPAQEAQEAQEAQPESESPTADPAPAAKPVRRVASGDVRAQQAAAQHFPGLPADGHAAYATGAAIHVHALEAGGTRLENTDLAFSGAAFSSAALSGVLANELSRPVSPVLEAGAGFGRGSGVEVGLAMAPDGEPQITEADKAEAKSPPSTDLVSNEVGPVEAAPALVASLLRGQAQARAAAACTTGVDLSFGQGMAADVGLVADTLDTTADDPTRGVSQSTSRTFLVPQEGASSGPIAKFGLASETRQTIAPVTIGGALTLEFLGEWVLRAVADGKSGKVTFGPGEVSPETPILRIFQGDDLTQQVTFQQFFGETGLEIEVPGVASIVLGEDPRAIGGDASSQATETATAASAAIDVARVQLAGGDVADVRIGHMEAAVAVPEGGIECGIGMLKKADPESVNVGETFIWTVTVTNPNDCVLTNVKVVDTITTTPGIKFAIEGSTPTADSTTADSLTWNDVGPIQPGGKKDLIINMRVLPDSEGGRFTDDAVATGVCGPATGQAGEGVLLEARVSLNLPEVVKVVQAVAELPRTGGMTTALPALVLTGLGFGLRQVTRRRRAE